MEGGQFSALGAWLPSDGGVQILVPVLCGRTSSGNVAKSRTAAHPQDYATRSTSKVPGMTALTRHNIRQLFSFVR